MVEKVSKFGDVGGSRFGERGVDKAQVVEIARTIQNTQTERIPDHVWSLLQEAGVQAASHLVDMLQPVEFSKLSAKDKRALVDLAMSRAYGRPDPGIKRSVQVQLSAKGNDAVAASLARLGDALALPEYSARKPENGGNDDL